MSLRQIQEILPAEWVIHREVLDLSEKCLAEMKGIAKWGDIQSNVFLYEERVENCFQTNTYTASNEYLYVFDDERMFIKMTDGRVFARFQQDNMLDASSIFECGQDLYETTLKSVSEEFIEMQIKISGPKKEYLLFSQYSLIPAEVSCPGLYLR